MSETKKRNAHLPEFKVKEVGLEAVRGVKTVSQSDSPGVRGPPATRFTAVARCWCT